MSMLDSWGMVVSMARLDSLEFVVSMVRLDLGWVLR